MAKGIVRFGILLLLTLITGYSYASSIGDLLISEIMVNPAALSDTRGEWFELYNPTDQDINLRGFSVGDDGSDLHKFESDLLILPGEYLTLARSFDPGFVPDYVYNGFTLANGSDEIVFRDGLIELLRLDYINGFGSPGHSRELIALPMQTSNYGLTLASLGYGSGDIGTPGTAGSVSFTASVVPLPAAAWLFISGVFAVLSPAFLPRAIATSSRPSLTLLQSSPVSAMFPGSSRQITGSSRYFGLLRKKGSLGLCEVAGGSPPEASASKPIEVRFA